MSMLSPLHAPTSMPSLNFRSTLPSNPIGFASPPSSPPSSSSLFGPYDGAALLDFPFLFPTTATPTTSSSSSSSPSSSPLSLSADDSSSEYGGDARLLWHTAAGRGETTTTSASATIHTNANNHQPIHTHRHHLTVSPLSSTDRSAVQRHTASLPHSSHRSARLTSSASSVSDSTASDASSGTSILADAAHISATTTTHTTHSKLKRKRTVAALSTDERLQRRRAQHRAVDANRRQKENDAIGRLLALINQQSIAQQAGSSGGAGGSVSGLSGDMDDDDGSAAYEDETERDSGSGTQQQPKAGRLTVLESSIALIEQLTSACQRMEAACNAKDAQVSRVSGQLHSVAAHIAQQATQLALSEPMDLVGGLSMSGLLPETSYSQQPWQTKSMKLPGSALLPFDYSTGSLHSSLSPHSPSASNFLSVLPPSASSYLLQSDMSHTLRQSTMSLLSTMCVTVVVLPSKTVIEVNDRFLAMCGYKRSDVMYRSLEGLSMRNIPQYPASVAAANEVMAGRKRRGTALWRCMWADGCVWENECTMYAIYDDPIADGEVRVPDKLLLLSSAEEAVKVDGLSLKEC